MDGVISSVGEHAIVEMIPEHLKKLVNVYPNLAKFFSVHTPDYLVMFSRILISSCWCQGAQMRLIHKLDDPAVKSAGSL